MGQQADQTLYSFYFGIIKRIIIIKEECKKLSNEET